MVGLALLVVVVIFAVAYGASRRTGSHDTTHLAGTSAIRGTGLRRWVDAGLISEEQATAIEAYEQAQREKRPAPRVSPAIEALAYTGGVLVAVGAGMLVGQFWSDLGTGARIGILAAGAVLTGVVGAVVGESDAVTWRLRGFLWTLSTAGTVAAAGLFAYDVLDLTGEPVALFAAALGTVETAGYWRLRDRPLQHLLTLAGIAVSISVAIAWAGGEGASIGLALWLLGGAWAWLAWQRRVPPAIVGFPLGAALTLVACGFVGAQIEWLGPLLGLATAGVWTGTGVASGEALMLAPGVTGVFVFLPWTLGFYFGDTFGAPAVAMLSGAALLGVVVVLVRRGGRRGDTTGDTRGHHFGSMTHP